MKKILILGGYGNFGKRIAESLVSSGFPIMIVGRNINKCHKLKQLLDTKYPNSKIEVDDFNIYTQLSSKLQKMNPGVIINNVGPFQNQDYSVIKTCIQHKFDYIDLADARDFVANIKTLDQEARNKSVSLISGASTVPALSSAIIDHYQKHFSQIESIIYGISPGQKAERGLATTTGILSYIGKRIKTFDQSNEQLYGWQNIYRQEYPELGKRWMANCEIPDLDLFPSKYNIKKLRFSAGMENSILHLGIWMISWLIRMKLPIKISNYSKFLLKCSHIFDRFGSDAGGMHMIMKGLDLKNKPLEICWFIIAKKGEGPHIPTIPAILLARKIALGTTEHIGSSPCMSLITLKEYLLELENFQIVTYEKFNRS